MPVVSQRHVCESEAAAASADLGRLRAVPQHVFVGRVEVRPRRHRRQLRALPQRLERDRQAAKHILTDNVCEDCHTTDYWKPAVTRRPRRRDRQLSAAATTARSQRANRRATCRPRSSATGVIRRSRGSRRCSTTPVVTGNCVQCHNGVDAVGKNATHIKTDNVCENCHSIATFKPAVRVDHTDVQGACSSCHNGVVATGKTPTHVPSNDTCDNCHTVMAWKPAVFDHTGVAPGTCATCHNGATATGKNATHISTSSSCDVCHTTVAWKPAQFDHAGVTGSCSMCHNGVQATGKGATHFVTARECDACHTTSVWSPSTFVHSSPSYPGNHRRALACTDCHTTNAEVLPWRFPAYQGDLRGLSRERFRAGLAPEDELADDGQIHRRRIARLRGCVPHLYGQYVHDDSHPAQHAPSRQRRRMC